MEPTDRQHNVNLFRPKPGFMKGELIIMLTTLVLWGVLSLGFQIWLYLSGSSSAASWLESFNFFNLPFHFWFTAQMLPLCFIIICVIYNLRIDRLTEKFSSKNEGFYD